MTFVRVAEECGRWRLRTAMGNAIGPRLWGAEPAHGLPPITDVFKTKDEAVRAAELWTAYKLVSGDPEDDEWRKLE